MLRIFLSAAAVFAVLTGAAHAQSVLTPRFSLGEDKRKLTPEEEEQKRQLDDAYKQATTKIPDQKAASDPWSDVRPTPSTPAPKKKQQ